MKLAEADIRPVIKEIAALCRVFNVPTYANSCLITTTLLIQQKYFLAPPNSSRRETVIGDITWCAQESPCLTIAASDLSLGLGAGLGAPRLRFLVLDCRREEQFLASTLPTALHLHAADDAELQGKVASLQTALVGQHVTLLFGGSSPVREAAAAVRRLVGHLLAHDTPHVSVVEDGFDGCTRLHDKGELELVSLSAEADGVPPHVSAPDPTEPSAVSKAKQEAEKAQRAAEESLKKAQAAAAAAAEKTKEKAKGWGAKGMGFLSSAFSKAKGAASSEAAKDKAQAAAATHKQVASGDGGGTDAKFSIEEDDDEDGAGGSMPAAREPSTPSRAAKRLSGDAGLSAQAQASGTDGESEVNVAQWVERPGAHVFPCKRVGQNGQCTPRYLILSEDPAVIMDVEAHRTKLNVASLKVRVCAVCCCLSRALREQPRSAGAVLR